MDIEFLDELSGIIAQRVKEKPAGSYVHKLTSEGPSAVRAKITEEAAELVEASELKDRKEIVWEAADLLFHMMVLLEVHGISLGEIVDELKKRQKPR